MVWTTDNGHPEKAFFQKFETFGLGQANWAEIFEAFIWGIFGQTISTILALRVPCSWESVAGYLSYTANAYRQTTDKLMFKSVISTVR